MNQAAIFEPFFTVIFLTVIVWFYMYSRRIPQIMKSKLPPDQITAAELARISPPAVSNPSDNLKNLFEIPTIFYAVVLYLYLTRQVDSGYLAAAWVFAAFRVLHSSVHCTLNIVLLRFWLYVVSTLALFYMIVRAGYAAFA